MYKNIFYINLFLQNTKLLLSLNISNSNDQIYK